jgi:hypothetical protein
VLKLLAVLGVMAKKTLKKEVEGKELKQRDPRQICLEIHGAT